MLNIYRSDDGAQKLYRWLKCFRSQPLAPAILVCFPFAGGGANFYRRWPEFFFKDIEIYAVQLPGRETRLREACVETAEEVSAAVIDEILACCRQRPLVLFGHSMGSLLAYDVATRLKKYYEREPKALFVSGRQAPHVRFGGKLHLESDESLITEIKRFNGTPAAVFEDEEMRNIVLPMLRSDYKLLETYRVPSAGMLTCPIVTCIGDTDSEATPDEMTNWKGLTQGQCINRVFSGDHFYIKEKLPELAGFLMESLSGLSII